MARPPTSREIAAERLVRRLDPYMTAFGVAWLIAWIVEPFATANTGPGIALDIVTYAVWAAFIVEFIARLIVDPSTWGFLKRRWWELIILVVPVLRFLRILRMARVARAARPLASAAQLSRSAQSRLASRVAYLLMITGLVIVIAGRVLYDFGGVTSYTQALHLAALGALGGHSLPIKTAAGQIVEINLILYQVVVFAAFAGVIGAFLLKTDAIQESLSRRNATTLEVSGPSAADD
ncbi:MAG: hypothetical protein WAT66_10630 [Actinomycetota bacterium]